MVKLTSEDKQVQTKTLSLLCLDHQSPQKIFMKQKESRKNNTLNYIKKKCSMKLLKLPNRCSINLLPENFLEILKS